MEEGLSTKDSLGRVHSAFFVVLKKEGEVGRGEGDTILQFTII